MAFKCKIGLHSWNGCKCTECEKTRDELHVYDGCICLKCGKKRDEQHDFSKDCEKCCKCEKTSNQKHVWKGCICLNCSKTRDEQHDWSQDCEKCSRCGKIIDKQHDWSKDCEKCGKCGKTRENKHNWIKDCERCSICRETRQNENARINCTCETCSNPEERFDNFYIDCVSGRIEKVESYLNSNIGKKFDLNSRQSSSGRTPLSLAASENHFEIVKQLIDMGADVNFQNEDESTPLHEALHSHNCFQIVNLLIQKGAKTEIKNENGETVLEHALSSCNLNPEVFKLLLDLNNLPIDELKIYSVPSIFNASKYVQPETLKMLFEYGMGEINFKDKDGWSPLHWAAFRKAVDIAEYLLERGSDTSLKTNYGKTAYDLAPDYATRNIFLSKPNKKIENNNETEKETETSPIENIKIGNQIWQKNNLDVITFNNGDIIPEAKTIEDWVVSGQTGKPVWCYYDNDSSKQQAYGRLYNWYAANDPRGLAPQGWHVATETDWKVLINFLGGDAIAGTKMKSTTGWNENNGSNSSGFR